ncbi:MAG: SDR family oxidoreductase [Lachnospiraceae bacterium]|nr:SDR family oxidoreductase [Lachnospiraceae bacterium]
MAHREELYGIFKEAFLERPSDEWLQKAKEIDFAAVKVTHFADLSEDEQAIENGFVEDVTFRSGNTDKMPRALPYMLDVSDHEAVHEVFTKLYEELGRIDILVNNAGINRDAMFHKTTYEQMRSVMEVNFFGMDNCCAEVILPMRNQEYGRIINISSTSAQGNVGQANYAASKAAINGFTKTLALESARKSITVNAVEPGFIDTDMLRTIPAEKLEARLKTIPPQRFGTVEELANTVLFLASGEASWVNGHILIASGATRAF